MQLAQRPSPRCVAIHDLSCYGHTSLMAAIPILTTMGIQVCPLPTAILSTHSQLHDFTFTDLTSTLTSTLTHWRQLGLDFDAIYSGFLGADAQVRIVLQLIDSQRTNAPLVLVDPVLGDYGRLYQTMTEAMVCAMRELVAKADVITPNLTELALLLGRPYTPYVPLEQLQAELRTLADQGPQMVVVTSVPEEQNGLQTSVLGYSRADGRFWRVRCHYLPGDFPGTGDAFASVLLGALLQHDSLPEAMERAVHFATLGVRATYGYGIPMSEGILVERILSSLREPIQYSSYEIVE